MFGTFENIYDMIKRTSCTGWKKNCKNEKPRGNWDASIREATEKWV
jgi:hypothetical protein